MKSETKIADGNIKNWQRESEDKFIRMYYYACEQHKASCQRFFRFLSEITRNHPKKASFEEFCALCEDNIQEKITDLENAIKKYDEAGI